MGLDDLSQHLADMRERLDGAHGELTAARFDGRSDDERVRVTVDSTGHLIDLMIDPRVFRNSDSNGLVDAILVANARASEQAKDKTAELWNNVLRTELDVDALDTGDAPSVITKVGRNLVDNRSDTPRGRSEGHD